MKTNLLKLRRAFSYVLCVLLTGSLAIAKANPQSNIQVLNETFESYTVGNKIAEEAYVAGNNWWTTWSNDPGSLEDGVVADYGGTKCGYYTQGNDQVLLLNENNDGVYNLEFDMLIPEGKKGYFNILHNFAGAQGSQWAFAAFINMDNNGYFTDGEGTFFIDGETLNQNVFVFDEWMHFRFYISTDNDLARLYYSTETTYQEEQLLFSWQWSHDTNGNDCGKQLDAMNFYGGYSDVSFYIDNISLELNASAFVVDGIKYSINDDGISVTVKGLADGVNASGDLNIPATVTFNEIVYNVTKIADYAFDGEYGFSGTLTIPAYITNIGSRAFRNCSGFTTLNYNAINCSFGNRVFENNQISTLNIGNGVEVIPSMGLSGLTGTLTIPNSVTSIGSAAFSGCSGLTGNLIIPNSVTSIDAEAFRGTGFDGTLTIPNGVTSIGRRAFNETGFTTINYNAINCVMGAQFNEWENTYTYECVFGYCQNLENLNIGENVQTISPNAFYVDGFTGDLVIPNSVTTIGAEAFSGTNFDGTLTIPENVTTIGRSAFYETNFTTVNYNAINCVMGEGVDWDNNVTYECVFGDCYYLETLNIGENVQVIPAKAFNVYYGFTGNLVIPNSVTTIGDYAFAETGFNGTMTMSNAVTSIGAYAFYNTQFTGTLTIPSSVTYIGVGAFHGTGFTTLNYNIINYDEEIPSGYDSPFYGMNSLMTLNIGNNVEVIPNSIFSISSLTGELVIPNSVTYIGDYAFGEAGFTGDLVIPNSVQTIADGAFFGCGFNGNLTIGNSVTTIGDYAFNGVGFTGNLVIPNSVTYIGNGAFIDTNFDGTLTIGNSVTSIGEYAFRGVGFTGNLVIPNSVITIGDEAFYNCESFTGNLTIGNAVTSIGNSAFSYCYGFIGNLIIGNSVETIGYSAFNGCGGFNGELTLPETITYIGDAAFRSCDEITKVNYNATNCTYMGNSNSPVFYDCVSLRQINIGENVENIPNYAFKRCSNVTSMNVAATVPPTIYSSTFGTVSRSIPVSVPFGTREVYRTAPYWSEFINISDDYTPTQYDYHWTVNVNQFSGDMTVIGVIQINGVEQENLALEIGAFCGSECRGRQMLTYYPQIDRYQVLLMLYGEDGDEFSFRLYNHENEEELLLGSENEITFETNATIGLPLNPYVFNFISMQNTALNSGWNWYSTYIEQNGINGLEMLENSLGEAGLMIQSRTNGYVEAFEYNDNIVWYGTLNSITNEQMYKVRTNASCNVMMTGLSATMSNHPITINNGWNWIGFPSGYNLSVNTALAGITPEINDMIKGRNGYATYVSYNENNFWYGTLNVLEPGQGYMYLSNSETPKTLVYQTGNRDANLLYNVIADGNMFRPVSDRFADNMTITAIVELDDIELTSENYELAAFVGDECRGSVKLMYVEPFNRYVAFLTVFGDESEEMRFVLADDNNVLNSTEKIMFVNDGVVGNLMDPAIIHFGTLSVENENSQAISVYPNPTSGLINIYCNDVKRIEVINAVGQIVMDMNVVDGSASIDLSNQNVGVYMLRVITNNETIVKRIIKE